jgi:hypothetical protein
MNRKIKVLLPALALFVQSLSAIAHEPTANQAEDHQKASVERRMSMIDADGTVHIPALAVPLMIMEVSSSTAMLRRHHYNEERFGFSRMRFETRERGSDLSGQPKQ